MYVCLIRNNKGKTIKTIKSKSKRKVEELMVKESSKPESYRAIIKDMRKDNSSSYSQTEYILL